MAPRGAGNMKKPISVLPGSQWGRNIYIIRAIQCGTNNKKQNQQKGVLINSVRKKKRLSRESNAY